MQSKRSIDTKSIFVLNSFQNKIYKKAETESNYNKIAGVDQFINFLSSVVQLKNQGNG